ncbi:MAG: hypothetical protein ACTSUE_20860 [Promethearchaeota archaeon]
MDDEEKLYWMKMIMGISCGALSIVIIPQELVATLVPVGWLRLIWLLTSWLLLPFLVVLLSVRFGFLGMTDKERAKLEHIKERGDELPKFHVKAAFKKVGGGKFILKTGVGAFFIWFLFVSTVLFTIFYP